MAIHPFTINHVPATASPTRMDSAQAANIEAWTEQAADALASVSLSAPTPAHHAVRGSAVPISIPLDDGPHRESSQDALQETTSGRPRASANPTYAARREPLRRDSLRRREALLKGKEGSRQRRRWENDRLLGNPWVQPPLPSDWEVRPTSHRHVVPYFLAPLWDEQQAQKRRMEQRQKRYHGTRDPTKENDPASQVPKEVRRRLKHARAAKGLLQDLEEDVRVFIQKWNDKQAVRRQDGLEDVDSDEEDEVVFVGRNGQMHDSPGRKREEEHLRREKLVFDALAEDRSAGFGRWLVHSIATYYGLKTYSVTIGDPARREAYVAINDDKFRKPHLDTVLPRPLWGMV